MSKMDDQVFGGTPKGKGAGPLIVGLGVAGTLLYFLMGESKADSGGGSGPGGTCTPAKRVDQFGTYSTQGNVNKCPTPGVASNPNFQWLYEVLEGEGPIAIVTKYFGSGGVKAKSPSLTRDFDYAWVELVDENPEYGNNDDGNKMSPYGGDRLNPSGKPLRDPSTGAVLRDPTTNKVLTNGVAYSFKYLPKNVSLRIPKSWNAYIDEAGNHRMKDFPFPPKLA